MSINFKYKPDGETIKTTTAYTPTWEEAAFKGKLGAPRKSLDGGLQCALIHSGDSDSTAAITGNLLGVMYPDEVFSHPLLGGLEGKSIIKNLVAELVN